MTHTRLRYFVVDAFTHRLFAGNPAAVVLLQRWPGDDWLRSVATEMNLSETAYLVPNAQGYDLRWFTPKVEVDLCGHATLASAVVLSHLGILRDGEDVAFQTRSGILQAERKGDRFQLAFPLTPEEAAPPPPGLLEALNVNARYVGRSTFDYLVELESESAVRKLAPDFRRLATVPCRGVIATARSDDPRYDFVSRFFAPAEGIDEDPVTGSAHCCLAAFWGKRLNQVTMLGHQVSARGGIVHVEVRGQRVLLGGEGVLFSEGELTSSAAS